MDKSASDIHIEIQCREYAVRVYADHPDNWLAGAIVRPEGDRGILSMANGKGEYFFHAMQKYFDEILESCGVVTLEGYVTPARARMLRMQSRGRMQYELVHKGMCTGREMCWVRLSANGETK